MLDYYSTMTLESNDQEIILSTNLSVAYDTVDHVILVSKMEFYEINGKELSLFKDYYHDWHKTK